MKQRIAKILTDTVHHAAHKAGWGELQDFEATVERPKQKEHGDFASNLALVLGNRYKMKPRQLAEMICNELQDEAGVIAQTEIAGPGFINIRLAEGAWQNTLPELEDPHFAKHQIGNGIKVLIEYVSANPTGPLHVGNARGGPIGDSLARILAQCGYEVQTEYYVNDIGGQVDRLGQSILHWMKEAAGIASELPEGGYFGEYVKELAREAAGHPERNYLEEDEVAAVDQLATWGVRRLLEQIQNDCTSMGSSFDRWIYEHDIRNEVDEVMQKLIERGVTKEEDGALWFVPSELREREGEAPGAVLQEGATQAPSIDERDSVLRRSDGEPTYFADDIVCHANRYKDGFDRVINVWGANHHGHVPRVKAALEALGYDPHSLDVVLYQYVRVCRGTETVKMSKRAGNYVTAREVLDEVGPDAMRFFLLQRAPSAHLDFDLELAKQQNAENPIYYIQYAHARICSIERKAMSQGIELLDAVDLALDRLSLPEELKTIQFLFEYPEIIEKAARTLEPHHIAFYLLDLARRFHNYYAKAREDAQYRVISEDIDSSRAKLYLLRVIKSVLADGLQLLNLSAPDEMRSLPEDEVESP